MQFSAFFTLVFVTLQMGVVISNPLPTPAPAPVPVPEIETPAIRGRISTSYWIVLYLHKRWSIPPNPPLGGPECLGKYIELEGTLVKSFFRGAALRRWLRRPDCPQIPRPGHAMERERITQKTVIHFSRASTHLGNSLVLYYPPNSNIAVAGSIKQTLSVGDGVKFVIRRQAPLPRGMRDPFARYPLFPASTYSSEMENFTDTAPVDDCVRCDPAVSPPTLGRRPADLYMGP
ncbi:hypothetical protein DFH08DRAFT_820466 [Mycena albidolilacea]|uniref:Uncharacterized protein n=1 Tax=Mycena albidolilacea TaxID=1033008 RepID=A0AAD6ZC02_9AGAR|nr:hypothetical protein DFH08DRAFT_820466 [Mycena albidolilacea]